MALVHRHLLVLQMVPLSAPRCGPRVELTNDGAESHMRTCFWKLFVFVDPEGIALILLSLPPSFSRPVLLDFTVARST